MFGCAKPDIEGARLVIESALAERRKVLTEMESKALLSAFHIPVTKTMLARKGRRLQGKGDRTLLRMGSDFNIGMYIAPPTCTQPAMIAGLFKKPPRNTTSSGANPNPGTAEGSWPRSSLTAPRLLGGMANHTILGSKQARGARGRRNKGHTVPAV